MQPEPDPQAPEADSEGSRQARFASLVGTPGTATRLRAWKALHRSNDKNSVKAVQQELAMTLASMPPVDEVAAEAAFSAMVAAGGATVEVADGVFAAAIVSDTQVTHLGSAATISDLPAASDSEPAQQQPPSTEQAAMRAQVTQLQAEFDEMAGLLSTTERAQMQAELDRMIAAAGAPKGAVALQLQHASGVAPHIAYILQGCATLTNLEELDPQPSATEWESFVTYAKASSDAECVSILGSCYYCGIGVQEDSKEAVRLFKVAAEQCNAHAQCKLGWCYEIGEGVKSDLEEAVRLYRLAADQRHMQGTFNLAMCLEKGEGVPVRDSGQAAHLFRLAADGGHADAKHVLHRMGQQRD